MCSLIQFSGFYGALIGLFSFPVLWWIIYALIPKGPFDMDTDGEKGTFIPLLTMYVDITKFVIGLASTSIALLVGSSIYHTSGTSGSLLLSFVSPLFLLAFSIIWGVCFMPFIALDYEAYRHNEKPYTRAKYSRNQALGFSSLICFALGYIYLILIIIKQH